jgi:hypothetical protein
MEFNEKEHITRAGITEQFGTKAPTIRSWQSSGKLPALGFTKPKHERFYSMEKAETLSRDLRNRKNGDRPAQPMSEDRKAELSTWLDEFKDDIRTICAKAWSGLSQEEKEQSVGLFHEMLTKAYARKSVSMNVPAAREFIRTLAKRSASATIKEQRKIRKSRATP